jgi:Delta7-sterol 5-desaturase
MEAALSILRSLPMAYVQSIMFTGAGMLITYLVVWRLLAKRLQRWRVQLKQRADADQIKSELKHGLLAALPGAVTSAVLLYSSTFGYTKLYSDMSLYGTFWSVACLFVMWIFDDAWFYWVHRTLHHKSIYRFIHRIHHDSIDVTPFTSMSFHIAESFLLTAWIIPAVFFVPIWSPALGLLQFIGVFNNLKSHLGYELYPAWFNKGPLRLLVTSTHHNMHHSKFQGNYGLHFRFWDKICGTEFKDYSDTFDAIKARGPETVVVPAK